jgi:hypothetical protein
LIRAVVTGAIDLYGEARKVCVCGTLAADDLVARLRHGLCLAVKDGGFRNGVFTSEPLPESSYS